MKRVILPCVALLLSLPLIAQSPGRPIQKAKQTAQAADARETQAPDVQKKAESAPGQEQPAKPGNDKLSNENVQALIKDELESPDTTYRYDSKGRRDPFRSLLIVNQVNPNANCNKDSLECLLWDDVTLQGVWKVKGVPIGQILAKNGNVFWVKDGDSFYDGQVIKIDMGCVYLKQKVNDPSKINPFRDVEKCLAPETTK